MAKAAPNLKRGPRGCPSHGLGGRRRLLETILELSVATLGRISARDSLGNLVSTQYQQMAGTARAHADELTRRDESERAMRALAFTDALTGLNKRRKCYVHVEYITRLARLGNKSRFVPRIAEHGEQQASM